MILQLKTGRVEADYFRAKFGVDILSEFADAFRTLADRDELKPLEIGVNSSHHQAAATVGDALRVAARCPQDGVVEALEGTAPGHFVLAVQWHPERTYDDDAASRALFRAFLSAARNLS